MRRLVAVALLLACIAPARADEVGSLPLADPPRGLELVVGASGEFLDLAGEAGAGGSRAKSFDDMVLALAGSDIVILGEQHTHDAGHRLQARILRGLMEKRDCALGMEFFESEDDAALARYVAGQTTLPQMIEETKWYEGGSFNFEYYRPLVDACREKRAPVLGLNVPRDAVRTVSRKGWDALTDEQKTLVGELGPVDPRHRFLVDLLMGGVGSTMGPMFDGMVSGQMTWDAAATQSVLRARSGAAKGRLLVVIFGMGHTAHGLGIPARRRAADPALKVAVVNPVVAEKPPEFAQAHPGMEVKATATLSRGYADWACVLPDELGAEAWPTFGVTLENKDGAKELTLTKVEEGSVAARAGLLAGDVLLKVGGETAPGTLGGVRAILAGIRWGRRTEVVVRRGGAEVAVPVIVVPAVDGPGRWLESEPASHLLDAFDPLSSARVAGAEPAKAMPSARLVKLDDAPVRVDVTDGQRLLEAWTLDDRARPVLGLLARPAQDGAVRVEIDRGPAGEVLAQRRYDAAGTLIAAAAVPDGATAPNPERRSP